MGPKNVVQVIIDNAFNGRSIGDLELSFNCLDTLCYTLYIWIFSLRTSHSCCRNPTLAKCGGEAQHLEKVMIWSPLGLPNVQSSTARPKTPRIEVFLVSLERS
jgi:hypothetical protein